MLRCRKTQQAAGCRLQADKDRMKATKDMDIALGAVHSLSEIGSCAIWSLNVWGPDYVSLTDFQ
jgi:hypothetical protein